MADAVRVTGIRESVRKLERLGAQTSDLKGAFRKVGDNVTKVARRLAPKRTGRLAASIRPSNAKNRSVIRAGRASVPYAGPIHWGWPKRNIAAQPFLADAVEQEQDRSLTIIEAELQRIVRQLNLD